MYSNLVPIVAMGVAAVWLGEALTVAKVIGATTVLGGVALTRFGSVAGRVRPMAQAQGPR